MVRYIHLNTLLLCRMPAAALVGLSLAVSATATTITTDTSIPASDATYDDADLTIDGARVTMDGAHAFSELRLTNGATLTHAAGTAGFHLVVSGDVVVDASSAVDVSGKGHGAGSGAGAGCAVGSSYGSGAGHGGRGGGASGAPGSGGVAYGVRTHPLAPGSGGGSTSTFKGHGGAGGGLIRMDVQGVLSLDGEMRANGNQGGTGSYGRYAGGGSGGGIWLTAGTLNGSGSIHADGGNSAASSVSAGGGAGGRIALYCRNLAFDTAGITATHGNGTPTAEDGSIHISSNPPPARITDLLPTGTLGAAVSRITLSFVSPIDTSTLTLDDVRVTGPTNRAPDALTVIDAQTVSLEFSPALDKAGQYYFAIGPHIESLYGGEMDQDLDGLPGEESDDVYVDSFILATHAFDASTPITITSTLVIPANDSTYDRASLTIDHAMLTIDGAHAFADLHLTNGATLTHTANTPGLLLSISNSMSVSSNSTIDLTARGYPGVGYADGLGPGAGRVYWYGGSGGGHGGEGAASVAAPGGGAYGSVLGPLALGSSGGSGKGWPGGAGGGAIRIDVGGALTLDGAIHSDGLYGNYTAGGGSGGSVWLRAGLFQGGGTVTANGGGLATQSYNIGGGGGGRIAVEFGTNGFAGTLTAFGGYPRRAAAGTISLRDMGQPGGALHVVADNNTFLAVTPLTEDLSLASLTLSAGAYVQLGTGTLLTAGALIVTNGVSYLATSAASDHPPIFADIIVHSGASLSSPPQGDSHDFSLKLRVTGDVVIPAGAALDVRGRGYSGGAAGSTPEWGHGPGGGVAQWYAGGGGSHAGRGGTSSDYAPGGATLYGDPLYPTTPGSGGGGTYVAGGGTAGGGVIWLMVDGDVMLDGRLDAGGLDYTYGVTGGGGGGAGGSIFLCARSLAGLGVIDASGGGGHAFSGRYSAGGGGGRVALYTTLDGFDPARIRVAAGALGNPLPSAGSYHHATSAPPASIGAILPFGYVTQALETVTVIFAAPIDSASFSSDDIVISGPQPAAVAEVRQVDATTFTLILNTTLGTDGTYEFTIGPRIASFAGGLMDGDGDGLPGEVPADCLVHSLTIDRTPPAPPVIANCVAPPATNMVATTLPELAGTKDADSSLWRDERQLVDAGSGMWSNRVPLLTGLTTLSLKSMDPAGNLSAPTNLLFLADIVAPCVLVISPADGTVTSGEPTIGVTFREGASGLDLERSELAVLCNSTLVPGRWTPLSSSRVRFDPDTGLAEGLYRIDITLHDRAGLDSGPQTSSFEIDRTGPAAPVIQPVTSPTEATSQWVQGSKPADTALFLNGVELEPLSTATVWSVSVQLTQEVTRLTFHCEDGVGNVGRAASVTIAHLSNTPPDWWRGQGIADASAEATNDWAALNVGQLKWMAHGAANAFDEALPWGAGAEVTALIGGFSNGHNFSPVSVGQLKHVATPFYDRLGLVLPWLAEPATNDWALANVGQLKHLFDLRPARNWDDDGLPDWWEALYWGDSDQQADDSDDDGDGLSNLEEFLNHSDPTRADSDLDGCDDPTEVARGSDPSDAASFPVNIAGAITYAGSATGPVRVVAASGGNRWMGLTQLVGGLPASYLLTNAVSDTTYSINAWMDVDRDGSCDPWEPTGAAHGFPRALLLGATGVDILLTHPDSDGDGLADMWELDQFGTLLPDGATDSDGDGLTNLEEFEQGHNPMSPDGPALDLPADATIRPGQIGLTIYTPGI